jgi:aspartate aminotransferase-like enzyme
MISVSNKAWKMIKTKGANSYYFDLLKYKQYHKKKETPYTPAISPILCVGGRGKNAEG